MTAASLEAAVRAVEPAARLVSERHLRKVLYALRDRGRAVPANPELPLWITRDELLAADVLPAARLAGEPARLLLLTDPDDRQLTSLPPGEQLRAYWRLLFQAAVLKALDEELAHGKLTRAAGDARLAGLGPAAEREVRYVLETDHRLDPAADGAAAYRAFAAAFLDLRAFNPAAVADFFPSLPEPAAVALLTGDLDVPALLAHSRPAGAADRAPEPPRRPGVAVVRAASPGEAAKRLASADAAEAKGNFVRAAILRFNADPATAPDAIGKLVAELGRVLHWDDATQKEWREALAALMPLAAAGSWSRAARCLYELQTVAADLSRPVYAVDLVEPIRTLGRRPVKRPLPHAPRVIGLTHLRAAHRQLLRGGLGEQDRSRLETLFHHEIHHTEAEIRRDLGPVITTALTESGIVPENRVEEVARDKAVAELLDRVCERGFLRIGDLRDAVARNQLKLPDLRGPGELIAGDPLLRADTRLAYDLDGVYRRGEAYLRLLQRTSSVFFGTPVGRLLTLYVIGPFLAAFLTLMMLEELRHLGGKVYAFAAKKLGPKPPPPPPPSVIPVHPEAPPEPRIEIDEETGFLVWVEPEVTELATSVATSSSAPASHPPDHGSFLIEWPTILGFGLFLLLVFHVPPFRRAVVEGLRLIGRGVRGILWDAPGAVWRSPVVTAVRRSAVARFLHRHVRAPLILSALVLTVLFVVGVKPRLLLRMGWAIPAVLVLAYNTPWGWVIQDRIAEAMADWWRVIRVNLVPGAIAWVIDEFRAFANWVERQLYAVDEWLRFRGGDSDGSLALKATLGLVWFPFAYLIRFAFYLLLEPQINPVKHFPVVTVSHKVILPMTPSLADAINVSEATAAGILGCIPGVFGFIAWELMANWRLYRANRPDRLKPVMLGSHGETMRGLLRPGFHSGTVPKLFRKLRTARDRDAAARRHHELEHAAEAVERFVERELIHRLEHSPGWDAARIEVAAVRFGCQRVTVELAVREFGPEPLRVAFENRGGEIAATLESPAWLDALPAGRRAALLTALQGLFEMGAALDPLAHRLTWAEWVRAWDATDTR